MTTHHILHVVPRSSRYMNYTVTEVGVDVSYSLQPYYMKKVADHLSSAGVFNGRDGVLESSLQRILKEEHEWEEREREEHEKERKRRWWASVI